VHVCRGSFLKEGLATDIVLFLNVDKLFAAARLVSGDGKLERAYRGLHDILRQLEIETKMPENNAESIKDLEEIITLERNDVAEQIEDLLFRLPTFDKKRLPTSDDLQKLVSRLDANSAPFNLTARLT
jgi:hypothetical protein